MDPTDKDDECDRLAYGHCRREGIVFGTVFVTCCPLMINVDVNLMRSAECLMRQPGHVEARPSLLISVPFYFPKTKEVCE